MKRHRWLAVGIGVLVMAAMIPGCGGPTREGVQPQATPPARPTNTPIVELPGIEVPAGAEELVQRVREELAARLNQVGEPIDLVDVQPAEWPTAAMDCPEPDTAYAQVVTSGYVIRLNTDGKIYEVHVSDRGQVVFCDTQEESRAMEVPTAAEPAVRAARQDLASRIGVAAENVQVEQVESVEWRDSSLGCPEPGKMYLQVITPGYRVVLKAGDQTYEYHTDRGNRAVYCGEATARATPLRLSVAEVRDLVERARDDLAERQGVDPASISVAGATPVPALDQPAPCPQADQLAGDGPGYQIELQIEGTSYVYRGRGEAVVLCSP